MSTSFIDGKAAARRIRERVADEAGRIRKQHGVVAGLAVVLVGSDPASRIYVRNKGRQVRQAGMHSFEHRLDQSVTEDEVLALIHRLNADPAVHGILVQLPLPDQIDDARIIQAIAPAKDVDGFHVRNVGLLATSQNALVPCTPLGCRILLRQQLGSMSGQRAVIIGRSNIVGKPMAMLLLQDHCTVTVAHSRTRDLPGLCRTADILVAAVGRPEMVRGDWIKPGATIIDVGINRIDGVGSQSGKARLVGDVAFGEAIGIASAITPVPGGVGPMTIACLLANTLTACCDQHRIVDRGKLY